jgi:hypothetical protein
VVGFVAGGCAWALYGWFQGAADARRGCEQPSPSSRSQLAIARVVLAAAVVAALAAPATSVLWILVALNLTLGRRESVPFSTYSMYSEPKGETWSLRIEDMDGNLMPIAQLGILPTDAKKRFATETRAARRRGITDLGTARRCAAAALATEIEDRRPTDGPWANGQLRIALDAYRFESGKLVTSHTVLHEMAAP